LAGDWRGLEQVLGLYRMMLKAEQTRLFRKRLLGAGELGR